MGLLPRFLRIPRPQTFLYVMSLQTGASLITLSLLLNKISGLYGLLALLTGYHLSPVQLSMYLYSIIALVLTVLLFPYIRKQSPLQCLALAWLYVCDSAINAAYTAAFGVTWFLVIGQHTDADDSGKASGPGSDTIGQTAGFTGSEYDTAKIRGTRNTDQLGSAVTQPESFQSILLVCVLWSIRIYFVFVMLAFARHALRLYVAMPRHTRLPTHSRNTSAASMASIASVADIDREPFSPYSPDGQGWKGKLGRLMISVGKNYWLGEEDDGNGTWVNMSHRFHSGPPRSELPGPLERERRRRSGTGPPQPSQAAVQAAALQQPSHERNPSSPGLTVKIQDWDAPRSPR
ncbi:Inositolphosphorylceramide synthase subunit Kei1-domain-containing protein [Aspergillus venezuelensis]